MSAPASPELTSSYTPALARRPHGVPGQVPASHAFEGAVLFTDITGFTALTESLALDGLDGAERITGVLNRCFGRLVDIAIASGGDVVKFAGDAFTAVWPAEQHGGLTLATRMAAQAGLAMEQELRLLETGYPMALRVGISAGPMLAMHLGGHDRRELLLLGPIIAGVARAEQAARPGGVVVTLRAWQHLAPVARGRPEGHQLVRLEGITERLELPAPEPSTLDSSQVENLRPYLPRSVRSGYAGGASMLAELRPLTVLFMSLPQVHHGQSAARCQELVVAAFDCIRRYEGSVNKIVTDDKGTSLVAALGLPPLAHEDDAVRGCQAALELHATMRELGSPCSIGIASGTAFCGEVGSVLRREYTMIGDTVNLAARLMQSAKGSILACGQTHTLARKKVTFEALPPIRLKGRAEPEPIFQPLAGVPHSTEGPKLVMGRQEEKEQLRQAVEGVAVGARGERLLLQGAAGIGKSSLVAWTLERARARGVEVLLVNGDSLERSTAYFAWRRTVRALLGVDPALDRGARSQQALRAMEAWPELEDRRPLLGDILDLDLDDTELTRHLEGGVRADNTRALVVELLQAATRHRPTLVLVEDAHWLDSLSLGVLGQVATDCLEVALIITTRPPPEAPPELYSHLLSLPRLERILLQPMEEAEVLRVVAAHLGVVALPPAVARLTIERAGGNPFYSVELARHLVEQGVLRVEGERCELGVAPAELAALKLPDTIHGLLISRFDRLDPEAQLTVKIASVVGRTFPLGALAAVHPVPAQAARIAQHLATLERHDISSPVATDPSSQGPTGASHRFNHALTQEAAYALLVFERRRTLHRRVAEWYEASFPDRLATFLPLLAEHYRKAEAAPEAVRYLALAGLQARDRHANEEGARFLEEALELAASRGVTLDKHHHAELVGARGEIAQRLNDVPVAVARHHEALRLAGKGLPRTRLGLGLGLLGQTALQALYLLLPSLARLRSDAHHRRFASDLYQRLAELAYMRHAPVELVYSALRSHNLAETGGPSVELAHSSATLGIVTGLLPWPALARRYHDRARTVALGQEDPAALGYVDIVTGAWMAGAGMWAELEERSGEASAIFERLGDRYRWEQAWSQHSLALLYRGHLGEAQERMHQLRSRAHARGGPMAECWALVSLAEIAVIRGEPILEPRLERLDSLLDAPVTDTERVLVHGVAAWMLAVEERDTEAMAHIRACLELLGQRTPTSYYSYSGISGCVRGLLELAPASPEARRLLGPAVGTMGAFARSFPTARPAAWLLRGLHHELQGEPRRAARSAARAHLLATELDLRLVALEAQALLERLSGDPAGAARQALDEEGATGIGWGPTVTADDPIDASEVQPPASARPAS